MVAGEFEHAPDWQVDHEFDLTDHAIEVIFLLLNFMIMAAGK